MKLKPAQQVREELIRAEARLSYFDEIIASKDKQIEDLQHQVKYLQEALVSKEAPMAYQFQKELEVENQLPATLKAARDKTAQELRIVKEYNSLLEGGSVIQSRDDLMHLFTGELMNDTEPKSLHGNSES